MAQCSQGLPISYHTKIYCDRTDLAMLGIVLCALTLTKPITFIQDLRNEMIRRENRLSTVLIKDIIQLLNGHPAYSVSGLTIIVVKEGRRPTTRY